MEGEDRRGSGREEERMDRVKGEICYSGLGEERYQPGQEERRRGKYLPVGHCRHLWYDECR